MLVWIYGGGLAFGGESAYNGSALAARHGAVVVTMNYVRRLLQMPLLASAAHGGCCIRAFAPLIFPRDLVCFVGSAAGNAVFTIVTHIRMCRLIRVVCQLFVFVIGAA